MSLSIRSKSLTIAGASIATLSVLTPAIAFAQPNPATVTKPMHTNGRTQVSVDHISGLHAGTPNENEARYSLSLTKLLIADYVFEHGTPADKAKASDMIIHSNDGLATELSNRYPTAIRSKASQYRMNSAVPASSWGNWRFSSADWSRYLTAKRKEDPTGTGPLLTAMRMSTTTAADGYNQRYGVALLPGVKGWKSGWSDDRRTFHASVGYGDSWTVAVQTNGTSGDLNRDLVSALNSGVGAPAPAPAPGGMVNYPARAAARSSLDATQVWIKQSVGGIDPIAADAISRSVGDGANPAINAIPEYILLPAPVAQALPQPR